VLKSKGSGVGKSDRLSVMIDLVYNHVKSIAINIAILLQYNI
jgi:hypothetical protein